MFVQLHSAQLATHYAAVKQVREARFDHHLPKVKR